MVEHDHPGVAQAGKIRNTGNCRSSLSEKGNKQAAFLAHILIWQDKARFALAQEVQEILDLLPGDVAPLVGVSLPADTADVFMERIVIYPVHHVE